MIHALENFPTNVVAFLCTGRITKGDYDTVVTPTVAGAFKLPSKNSPLLPDDLRLQHGFRRRVGRFQGGR